MQCITVEDAAKVLNDEFCVFFDVRKAADHETSGQRSVRNNIIAPVHNEPGLFFGYTHLDYESV